MSQLLHAFLAFLLFLEQLAFAGHVAAIAFCEHVLAQCLDGGTGDDRAADGRLHRDLEHLPRNELVHLVHQLAAALVGAVAVHNDRQRIHLVAVDEDVEFHQRRGFEMAELVVERGVAAARRLQAIEEVQHHLPERQLILQRHLGAQVLHLVLRAALVIAQLQHRAHVIRRHQDVGHDDRLTDLVHLVGWGELGRIVDVHDP